MSIRVALLMLLVVLAPCSASASDPALFAPEDQVVSVSPAVAEVAAPRGDTARVTWTIANQTEQRRRMSLSVQAVSPAAGTRGDIVIEDGGAVAAWTTVKPGVLDLQPGAEATVTAEIAVPDDAEAGGHFGSLVVSLEPADAGGVSVQPSLQALLLITVRGGVRRDLVVSLRGGRRITTDDDLSWTLVLDNRGNVHEVVRPRVTIGSLVGGDLRVPARQVIVLPGSRRLIPVRGAVRAVPDLHVATADVQRQSVARPLRTSSRRTLLLPWWFIVTSTVIIAAAIWRIRVLRHRRDPAA